MISDVKHLFMYLLAIHLSSLEKHLFQSSSYFFIRLVFATELCLCIFDINPLSDILFYFYFITIIVSHLVGCLFILLMVSLAGQKLFNLM